MMYSISKIKNNTISIMLFSILIAACKGKEIVPPDPNEEELITTLQLNFVDSAGVLAPRTAAFRDLDGDGGNTPVTWDTIRLKANTTWLASLLLLDESKTPADTISNEVLEEGVDHLFCYTVQGAVCTINLRDLDLNGLGIGLLSKWRTGAVDTGNVQVVLRHQPGVKTGSCAPGSSDVDVTFPLVIE